MIDVSLCTDFNTIEIQLCIIVILISIFMLFVLLKKTENTKIGNTERNDIVEMCANIADNYDHMIGEKIRELKEIK